MTLFKWVQEKPPEIEMSFASRIWQLYSYNSASAQLSAQWPEFNQHMSRGLVIKCKNSSLTLNVNHRLDYLTPNPLIYPSLCLWGNTLAHCALKSLIVKPWLNPGEDVWTTKSTDNSNPTCRKVIDICKKKYKKHCHSLKVITIFRPSGKTEKISAIYWPVITCHPEHHFSLCFESADT